MLTFKALTLLSKDRLTFVKEGEGLNVNHGPEPFDIQPKAGPGAVLNLQHKSQKKLLRVKACENHRKFTVITYNTALVSKEIIENIGFFFEVSNKFVLV